MTLSTVGLARIDCSDIREKPSNNPPHPAKRKSMATKDIISLVGILAVLVRCESGLTEESVQSEYTESRRVIRVQRRRPAYSLVNCNDVCVNANY